MIKNLAGDHIFNEMCALLARKTQYEDYEEEINAFFGASFFDFLFATSDYAKRF